MKADDLILVIDMQNVYLPGSPWACPGMPGAADNIRRIIAFKEAGGHSAAARSISSTASSISSAASVSGAAASGAAARVVFTRFIADPDASYVWNDYNTENAAISNDPWMNALVSSLREEASRYPVLDKSAYSAFSIPALRTAALDTCARGGRIVLTGVVADCCVLSTAFAGIDLGCKLVYLPDACAALNETSEKATAAVLSGLSPLHVLIMPTAGYLAE